MGGGMGGGARRSENGLVRHLGSRQHAARVSRSCTFSSYLAILASSCDSPPDRKPQGWAAAQPQVTHSYRPAGTTPRPSASSSPESATSAAAASVPLPSALPSALPSPLNAPLNALLPTSMRCVWQLVARKASGMESFIRLALKERLAGSPTVGRTRVGSEAPSHASERSFSNSDKRRRRGEEGEGEGEREKGSQKGCHLDPVRQAMGWGMG
jgi:hypothetical protein